MISEFMPAILESTNVAISEFLVSLSQILPSPPPPPQPCNVLFYFLAKLGDLWSQTEKESNHGAIFCVGPSNLFILILQSRLDCFIQS